MNVKIVRLKSGEELIGSIIKEETNEQGTFITIAKSCIILPSGEAGQIGLYKFMSYGKIEDGLTVNLADTYFIVEPQDDLTGHYETITKEASSIIGAEEKKIIT